MSMTTTLTHLTFDCADAEKLATFWSAVLDQPVGDDPSPEYAVLKGTPGWMFLQVPEAKTVKNRVHPDLSTGDLTAEVTRLKELGATHLTDHTEDGTTWTTLADPEGNEFDIVAS
jgi:catechol 2,3-dioxygenase-like lactoylglutathione lyase family enzyme